MKHWHMHGMQICLHIVVYLYILYMGQYKSMYNSNNYGLKSVVVVVSLYRDKRPCRSPYKKTKSKSKEILFCFTSLWIVSLLSLHMIFEMISNRKQHTWDWQHKSDGIKNIWFVSSHWPTVLTFSDLGIHLGTVDSLLFSQSQAEIEDHLLYGNNNINYACFYLWAHMEKCRRDI